MSQIARALTDIPRASVPYNPKPFEPDKFHPTGSRVLVRLDKSREMTPSGLYLAPESVREESWGSVIAIGPDIEDLKPGDIVLTLDHKGTAVGELNNRRFILYHYDDLVAQLEPSETPVI